MNTTVSQSVNGHQQSALPVEGAADLGNMTTGQLAALTQKLLGELQSRGAGVQVPLPVQAEEPEPQPVAKQLTKTMRTTKSRQQGLLPIPKWLKEKHEMTKKTTEATAIAEPAEDQGSAEEAKTRLKNVTKKAKAEQPKAQDYLMWVGGSYYPTIQDYIDEALKQGACKRLSKIPQGLIPGESRVFLAHDEGYTGDAVIFAYFTVQEIHIIVDDPEQVPVEMRDFVRAVTPEEAEAERHRECGERQPLGKYAVSFKGDASNKNKKFVVLDQPLDYNALIREDGRRFRSFRKVNGDELLASDAHKARPTERTDERVGVTIEHTDDQRNKDGSVDWTREEETALLKVVGAYEVKSQGFRSFARQSGRSLHSVSYKFYQVCRDLEKQLDEGHFDEDKSK
jgi:hypothetical protein